MDREEVKARVRRAVNLMQTSWNPEHNPGLLERQIFSRRKRPVRSGLWVRETIIPTDHDDALRLLFLRAVHELDKMNNVFDLPNTSKVSIEWSGCHRRENSLQERVPYSAKERCDALMPDKCSDFTILFVHGGGFVSVPSQATLIEFR